MIGPDELIARYVSGGQVDGDLISGEAFQLKPKDDGGLSVNWPAVFDADLGLAAGEIKRRARITVRPSGRYAILNVREILDISRQADELNQLSVIEDPLEAEGEKLADPSHALILGLPLPDDLQAQMAGDLLARLVLGVVEPTT